MFLTHRDSPACSRTTTRTNSRARLSARSA
jgi:hypothetical protein